MDAKTVLSWFVGNLAWAILVLIVTFVYKRLRMRPIQMLQIILGVLISGIVATLGAMQAIKTTTDSSILYILVGITHNATVGLFGIAFLLLGLEAAVSRLKRTPVSFTDIFIPPFVGGGISMAAMFGCWLVYVLHRAAVFVGGLFK